MPPERHSVVVTAAAAPIRRVLSSSAWLVLEELALRADLNGEVATSVRELAAYLGLAKDTIARALRQLLVAELIERHDTRDLQSGRFSNVVYRVNLDRSGLALVDQAISDQPPIHSSTEPVRPSRSKRSFPSNHDQLDLFSA